MGAAQESTFLILHWPVAPRLPPGRARALPHPYKKHMLPLCLEAENVDLPKGGKLLAIAWGNWYNKLILRKKDGEVPLCI